MAKSRDDFLDVVGDQNDRHARQPPGQLIQERQEISAGQRVEPRAGFI